MILIVGGAFQGKKKAAMEITGLTEKEILDGSSCLFEEIYSAKGICHFHEYIKRMLEEEIDTQGFLNRVYEENPQIVLISTELGYGVVPMQAFDRKYRELTGRICCEAAQKADGVYRVVAGIPVCIKGEHTCR